MTPLPFVPNVLKAQFQWTDGGGNPLYNNIFLSYSGGPPDDATALALAHDFFTSFAELANLAHNSVTLTGCRVTDLSSDSTGDALYSAAAPGMLTGDRIPISSCLLINYSIGRRYRGGKPRNYFPLGDSESLQDDRTWSAGFVTDCQEGWGDVIAAIQGTGESGTTIESHVNVSYYLSSVGSITDDGKRGKTTPTRRETPLVNATVGFSVASRVASQRRRLGRA
jgi:hypothetical protein